MIKVFALLFSPFNTWMSIVQRDRNVAFILVCFVLPLAVICTGIEGFSLVNWGERRGDFHRLITISQPMAVRYAVTQAVLFLACVLGGALALQVVAQSFHLATTFRQAFTAVSYSLGPIMLARLLDTVPFLNTWLCWGVGVMLSLSFLYHGIALVLKPDQTKGFGLYLISAVVTLFSTGVSHMLAIAVLHQKLFR
jgi:hypothetical protein